MIAALARISNCRVARPGDFLLGSLLCLSSVLKLLSNGIPDPSLVQLLGSWAGGLVTTGIPWLELLLALYIGVQRFSALSCAALMFLAFGMLSGWYVSSGIESCGCFGQFAVSPKVMFLVDIVALLVIGFSLMLVWSHESKRWSLVDLLSIIVPFAVLTTTLHGVIPLVRDSGPSIVYLMPEQWIGSSITIAGALNHRPGVRDSLASDESSSAASAGDWAILIYNPNCNACRRALDAFRLFTERRKHRSTPLRMGLLPVPYAELNEDSDSELSTLDVFWFSQGPERVIETPALVFVSDGIVSAVIQDFSEPKGL